MIRLWKQLSWQSATCLAALASLVNASAQVTVSVQAPPVAPGESTVLSVTIDPALDVAGADLVIRAPDFVLPGAAQSTSSTADFLVASHSQAGVIQIAMARAEGLTELGATILQIPLKIAKTAPLGAFTVTVDSARLYSQLPAVVASKVIAGAVNVIAPPADLDGDGLPDAWELQHLGPTGATADSDYDHDGVSDLKEFLAGTDPAAADSVLRVAGSHTLDASGKAAAAIQWQAQPGRNYEIEWSDGPIGLNMTWNRVYNPSIHKQDSLLSWTDDGSRTRVEPAAVRERYYRIVVVPTPQ